MRALYVFVVFLLLSQIFRGEASGSVFFIESGSNRYLRQRSSSDVREALPMSPTEIGAAVSVLLGLAPPAILTADGSSKLNRILKPNPFERPGAVFMLEVTGADDAFVKAYPDHALLGNALRTSVGSDSYQADIELPDESEVAVVSLDEPLSGMTDKDIGDFASWWGGLYAADSAEPLTGLLSIPLGNGANVDFHLAKEAERQFVLNLLVLSQNIRRAVQIHEDLLHGIERPAELMIGRFSGINALREEYGEGMAKQGMEVLLATLSKLFNLLERSRKGQIVGVIVFDERVRQESQKLLNVVYASRPSRRWLAEAEGASNSTLAAEVLLVRRTLAWLTGIILLIATLLGVYFLMNMPLTRDTLLYSNVKLD